MNTNKIAIFFPLDFIDGIIHRYVATVLQSLSRLHMNTCIEIFKKRITKQLPECSTERKNALWLILQGRRREVDLSKRKRKWSFCIIHGWLDSFYPIWITPSVWQNHLIHAGKSENFISKSTIGYASLFADSIWWIKNLTKPWRTLLQSEKKKV